MSQFDFNDQLILAHLILFNSKTDYNGFYHIMERGTQVEQSLQIYEKKIAMFHDNKSALWIPLTLEQKISLTMHQTDMDEFGFMIILIMKEYERERKAHKKTDSLIVYNLQNLIYDKYLGNKLS